MDLYWIRQIPRSNPESINPLLWVGFFEVAVLDMIIDHAYCLHEGIDNRRTDKRHASFFEIFCNCIRNWSFRWKICEFRAMIDIGFSSYKRPKVRIQTPIFFLELESCMSIFANRKYLQPIAHYPTIEKDFLEFFIWHICNLQDVPIMKEFSISLSLAQNRNPRKSCLCSLKYEKLKKYSIIMDRHSPLSIMIFYVELVGGSAPRTACYIFFHTNRIKLWIHLALSLYVSHLSSRRMSLKIDPNISRAVSTRKNLFFIVPRR